MKLFDMMTTEDMKRIKKEQDLAERVKELENSLSIALDINDKSQRENSQLKADLARAKEDHQYDNLVHQKELKDLGKN